MSESYVFYGSFYEAIKDLDPAVQLEIYTAVNEYALYGNEMEIDNPVARMALTLIKPQLEANFKRREDGKKGGRPMVAENKKPGLQNEKPLVAEQITTGLHDEKPLVIADDNHRLQNKKPNVNVNGNVNDNVNANVNENVNVNANENRKEPAPAPYLSPQLAIVSNMLQGEFGRTLSAMEVQQAQCWAEKYSMELITEAVKRAVLNGKRNLKYIDRILYDWERQGLKTVNDVEQYDKPKQQAATVHGRNSPGKKAAEPAQSAEQQRKEEMVRKLYVN